jgi:hypothetical protein
MWPKQKKIFLAQAREAACARGALACEEKAVGRAVLV